MLFKRLISTRQTPIIITNNAWKKMTSIINKSKSSGFIFSAESGGCNGLNFNLKLYKDDIEVENMLSVIKSTKIKPSKIEYNNVPVYIDPLSEMFLLGTTIDYVEEDIQQNIYDNKFIFSPDKTKMNTCGCGISFSPK